MENSVFVVKAPDEQVTSKYVLLVSRGGMMGGASSAFLVDEIVFHTDNTGKPHTVEATRAGAPITSFTYGTQYLVVAREQVEFMTALAAALKSKEEEDAVNSVWEADKKAKEASVVNEKAYL